MNVRGHVKLQRASKSDIVNVLMSCGSQLKELCLRARGVTFEVQSLDLRTLLRGQNFLLIVMTGGILTCGTKFEIGYRKHRRCA